MPINQAKFDALPKVKAGARKKGGRKCDWNKCYEHLRGQGWLVREVWEFAKADCIIVEGGTISRVRTKRWLDGLVTKKLAVMGADGEAFVYYVK